MDIQIKMVWLVIAVVLLIIWGVILKINDRQKKKLNTYRVVGDKAVPAFLRPLPRPEAVVKHFLPGQCVVITRKVTFYRSDEVPAGWIRGRDLEDMGGDRYKVMTEYGTLLLDDKGKENGRYLRVDVVIKPVELITFGYADEKNMWIEMNNLVPAYPRFKGK